MIVLQIKKANAQMFVNMTYLKSLSRWIDIMQAPDPELWKHDIILKADEAILIISVAWHGENFKLLNLQGGPGRF